MGIGQHKVDEAPIPPEMHPDVFVRCVLGLGVIAVLELGGILLVLIARLT